MSAEIGQHLRRMFRRFGRSVGPHHLAIGPDEHGHTFRPLLVGAVRRTIGHGNLAIRVTKQVAFKAYLLAPAFQVVLRAEGDAQQYCILIGIVLDSITEPVGLLRSAIAEGARIEPYEYVLPRVIRQTHRFPVLIGEGKGRRSRSYVR